MFTCHFVLHKVNIIPWYIYKQLGSIKTKQASHILQYVTHLHQHTCMVNTQLLHVPNVHTKYHKYFRGFLNSCLLSFARNSRKLMYHAYYHVYTISKWWYMWSVSKKIQKCLHLASMLEVVFIIWKILWKYNLILKVETVHVLFHCDLHNCVATTQPWADVELPINQTQEALIEGVWLADWEANINTIVLQSPKLIF